MSYEIPISYFRQYAFCPRILHFKLVRNVETSPPLWVQMGTEEHVERESRLKKKLLAILRHTGGKNTYNVHVRSNDGMIYGIADGLIEKEGEVIPLEFKSEYGKVTTGTILQLTGYAICAEERFSKPCRKGFIISGNRAKVNEIFIDEEKRAMFGKALKSIKEILEDGQLPDSNASIAKCCQCEYLNYCGDRDVY